MQAATKPLQELSSPTIYRILFAIALGHMMNDSMQAVVPATYPILEKAMNLSYTQIGLIAFTLNMTSSILQPVVGYYTDKKPSPFLLPFGMASSLIGMIGIAFAPNFYFVLLSVLFIGLGSAVFHPEGARVAYLAAGSRRGLAQSIYQVGGNFGNALAPVFTALIFVPLGQKGAALFVITASIGFILLTRVSKWYKTALVEHHAPKKKTAGKQGFDLTPRQVKFAVGLIIFIVFARSWYGAGISNFYQFYLFEKYEISIQDAQVYIFIFMISGVIGTFFGGPIADRFGKRNLMLASMLGTAPLAILLPYVSLGWVMPIFFLIGFMISTSFSVTVVYVQELMPGKIGMVSGLIVGLAFGMGALGAIALGWIADVAGLHAVLTFSSFLPLLGVVTWLLPSDRKVAS